IQEQVASAMKNKGVTYSEIGESQKAIDVYDELINRYANSTIDNVQVQVASAMKNKGVTYGEIGESLKEIDVYTELIDRFQDSKSNKIQTDVANIKNYMDNLIKNLK
ncbi:tetratricopeptide repeat protein, partial [Sulfuricurvum sp.]|uniref:tetratricopeptide repeat protein n=1 Tax=Sulfuricurvum sp. TaxID=2025608 RepID=UPI0025E5A727